MSNSNKYEVEFNSNAKEFDNWTLSIVEQIRTNCEKMKEETVQEYLNDNYSLKSPTVAVLCSVIFGGHYFYVGRPMIGVFSFFTFNFFIVGWLFDLIRIITGKFKDRDGRYLNLGKLNKLNTDCQELEKIRDNLLTAYNCPTEEEKAAALKAVCKDNYKASKMIPEQVRHLI